jgi:hypothetical protein
MKKTRAKYKVYINGEGYETWAVSEAQAINNVKYQLGAANSYKYHELKVTKVEILNIIEKDA